jgi:hypothetical protein
MDPYLENPRIWPLFQHELIAALQSLLTRDLLDRYQKSIGERRYAIESGNTSVDQLEEYLEIRDRKDGKVVTLVEVVSPANKTTAAGRAAYLDKRREGKDGGSNLVEIDLVMNGQPMLDYSREGLPDWDYAVTVTRSTQPERHEIYTATLQKRLPRFRLPLAWDDRDIVVDLQAAFARAFEQGRFGDRIDYRREPDVPLTAEKQGWLATLLKWPTFTHEEIAAAAYLIWMEEGCPQGRDREHWKLAIERLRA